MFLVLLSCKKDVISGTSFNDLKSLENKIKVQREMVDNYLKLRDEEVKKFENGGSSLLLVNISESKLAEGKIKLASLISKYQREKVDVTRRNPFMP